MTNFKYYHDVILPVRITSWLTGASVFEYPRGNLRVKLSILYSAVLFFNICISVFFHIKFLAENTTEKSLLYSIISLSIIYGKLILSLYSVGMQWSQKNNMQRIYERITVVDGKMEEIGLPKNYEILYTKHVYFFAIWSVISFILIALGFNGQVNFQLQLISLFAMSLPDIAMLAVDVIFISIIQHLENKLKQLNDFLERRTGSSSLKPQYLKMFYCYTESHEMNTLKVGNKTNIDSKELRNVRYIYSDLIEICQRVKGTFATYLLLSMTLSFGNIVYYIFGIYHRDLQNNEIIMFIGFFILSSLKVGMINYSCEKLCSEAQTTGSKAYELDDVTIRKELRSQIFREVGIFTVQLYYMSLKFDVFGIIDLGMPFVKSMIKMVAAYFFIVLQTAFAIESPNKTMCPNSTNSSNVKVTV